MNSGPKHPPHLAPHGPSPKDAPHSNTLLPTPLTMPPRIEFRHPIESQTTYPPMVPVPAQESPFLHRVMDISQRWVQQEWLCIEAIKQQGHGKHSASRISDAISEARLTPANLAKTLDNISITTLKRELSKLGAAPPGQIIKQARIAFAKHLLIHTRLPIQDVAQRAGYMNHQYFSALFREEADCVPTTFRNKHQRKTGQG